MSYFRKAQTSAAAISTPRAAVVDDGSGRPELVWVIFVVALAIL